MIHFGLEVTRDNRMDCVFSRKTYKFGGVLYRFKFTNGWGASVIKHEGSLGHEKDLWELAILDKEGRIAYDTPISDDVIGYLTTENVNDYLAKIRKL